MNVSDTITMTRREVQAMIDIEPVLNRLGLSLYCKRCHALGQKDGVRALNHPDDPVLKLECGCCVRVFRQES